MSNGTVKHTSLSPIARLAAVALLAIAATATAGGFLALIDASLTAGATGTYTIPVGTGATVTGVTSDNPAVMVRGWQQTGASLSVTAQNASQTTQQFTLHVWGQ